MTDLSRRRTQFPLRSYDPDADRQRVYCLWEETLGATWPISAGGSQEVVEAESAYRPGDHVVAEAGGQLAGFVATQVRAVPGERTPRGQVTVILVAPDYQRKGIGRALLREAENRLAERGVTEIQLGSGGPSYFWPGVPANLPGAQPFFTACGWPHLEDTFDLVRALKDYRTPPSVFERLQAAEVSLATPGAEEVDAVLALEAQHFPSWLHHYQAIVSSGAFSDLVVAKTRAGEIVGTSSVEYPHSAWSPHEFRWERLLGRNTGSVGPLGVREEMRGRGIGLALAARVTERLQERGLETAYVGYTWLVDWYGRLDYRVWQEYRVSRKAVHPRR
jgi:beta-N-acetylhexosaminidase